jgi:hypothetical protein
MVVTANFQKLSSPLGTLGADAANVTNTKDTARNCKAEAITELYIYVLQGTTVILLLKCLLVANSSASKVHSCRLHTHAASDV